MDTERNYVNVLEIITKTFKPVLSNSKARVDQHNLAEFCIRIFLILPPSPFTQIITRMDVSTIFANVDELLDAHNAFLRDMEDVMSKSTGRIISNCFLDHVGWEAAGASQ